jgi:hypothetical protein
MALFSWPFVFLPNIHDTECRMRLKALFDKVRTLLSNHKIESESIPFFSYTKNRPVEAVFDGFLAILPSTVYFLPL